MKETTNQPQDAPQSEDAPRPNFKMSPDEKKRWDAKHEATKKAFIQGLKDSVNAEQAAEAHQKENAKSPNTSSTVSESEKARIKAKSDSMAQEFIQGLKDSVKAEREVEALHDEQPAASSSPTTPSMDLRSFERDRRRRAREAAFVEGFKKSVAADQEAEDSRLASLPKPINPELSTLEQACKRLLVELATNRRDDSPYSVQLAQYAIDNLDYGARWWESDKDGLQLQLYEMEKWTARDAEEAFQNPDDKYSGPPLNERWEDLAACLLENLHARLAILLPDRYGDPHSVDDSWEHEKDDPVQLSSKFEQALQYATLVHAHQKRKGTEIPYIAHLLGVASIALEYGADEDEAIGALLHDAGEDAGGRGRIEDIRHRFGGTVATIVEGCTDAEVTPKPPWRQRKEAYIEHVAEASGSVRLVSAADKLHNARAILRDYRELGDDLWSRFNGGRDGTLWYYRALVNAFRVADTTPLVEELDRVVSEIERLAAEQLEI